MSSVAIPERSFARILAAAAALALIAGSALAAAGNARAASAVIAPSPVASAPAQRPAQWAQGVPGTSVGNLHRITPWLYRSAQFSRADVPQLRRLGIRKVISLRAFHADEALLAGSGIASQRIAIKPWRIRDRSVVAALRALREARTQGPVLIHCQQGADRTGLIAALYRVVYQGWSKEQALDELEHGGYGFHPVWSGIPRYIEQVDAQHLRERVRAAQ